MAENTESTAVKNNLSKEQKIGFILMLFFAIFAIGLGFLQIRNTFSAPFALSNKIPATIKNEINTVEALRFRDTDRDGLNDFDEIYVYTTSAYIVDTDSDGLSDKEEVDKGTNPLCAEGSDCSALGVAGAESPLNAPTTTTANLPGAETLSDIGPAPADLEEALKNPAQIRQMLIQSGLKKEVLDKISDADLMALVADTFKNNSVDGQNGSIESLNNLVSATATKK